MDVAESASAEFWTRLNAIGAADSQPDSLRAIAVAFLAYSSRGEDKNMLQKLSVDEHVPSPVREAALTSWVLSDNADVDTILLQQIVSGSPAIRPKVLTLMRNRASALQLVAEKLDSGAIAPRQIGAVGLKELLRGAKGDNKSQLQDALDSIVNSDRSAVLAKYKACLSLQGNAERGKAVFSQHCAACHQVAGIGKSVGPDISDSRTKQPIEILTAVLDPNLAIDNNYFRYSLLLKDGTVADGVVVTEANQSLSIIGSDAVRRDIRREDIQEMRATGLSLMPDGLEGQIDQQAMSDLIAFVKNWRYLDGAVPGLGSGK